jgi:hypothetical protein
LIIWSALRAEELFDQAEAFRRSICDAISDKDRCAAIAAKAIGIPFDEIVLARFVFPGGHVSFTPVDGGMT